MTTPPFAQISIGIMELLGSTHLPQRRATRAQIRLAQWLLSIAEGFNSWASAHCGALDRSHVEERLSTKIHKITSTFPDRTAVSEKRCKRVRERCRKRFRSTMRSPLKLFKILHSPLLKENVFFLRTEYAVQFDGITRRVA